MQLFLVDDPQFRDFSSSDFCVQFTLKNQVGIDTHNERNYLALNNTCEGRYIFVSREVQDSLINPSYDPDVPDSVMYGNLVFCELDIRGFTSKCTQLRQFASESHQLLFVNVEPVRGQRFFQVPTLPAGSYDVRAYLAVNETNSSSNPQNGTVGFEINTYDLVASEEELGFWDAELFCIDRYGGHLASPNTEVEYNQLASYQAVQGFTYPVMLGLHSDAEICRPSCDAPGAYQVQWAFTDGTTPDMDFLRVHSLDGLPGTTEDKAAYDPTHVALEINDWGMKNADEAMYPEASAPMKFLCEIDCKLPALKSIQCWCYVYAE
eukprot:SAG11_NODE_143_length_14870_cov_6.472412_10_plen_321_part_00